MALFELRQRDKELWQQYLKMLQQHASPWWKPDAIWQRLPTLIQGLVQPNSMAAAGLSESFDGFASIAGIGEAAYA